MRVREFFRGNAFRCVAVLTCIAVASGALLAICNDLLDVSEEERVMRTIKKIYGKEVKYEESHVDCEIEGKGRIDSEYRLEDGNRLANCVGYDGYQKGTVSVWLVAEFDETGYVGIRDVSIAGNEKQTLMSKFSSGVLERFRGKRDDYDEVVSGATHSSRALNNAVNVAAKYYLEREGEERE